MTRFPKRFIPGALILAISLAPAAAGIVVYENGDRKVEIGGQIQLQYANVHPEGGEATDEIFFRRLRPYVAGTVSRNWMGKIAFDFGKSLDADEVAVKDAFMAYSGVENLTVYIGNSKTPFSREFLTSSKRLELIERNFTGEHNFGTPDRSLGAKVDGHSGGRRLHYAASLGGGRHDPAVSRMDLDTPVNDFSDWNQGPMVAGRVDFYPRGEVKFAQADFHTDELRYYLGTGAFHWVNDDDVNTFTDPVTGASSSTTRADLDEATGFEIAVGLRGHGWSADAAYNLVSGDTVDPNFTGGLYRDGTTDMDMLAIQGGYMFRNRIEVVAAWDSLAADGYEDRYQRTRLGVNYYWNKHKGKVQVFYRMTENFLGVRGDDLDTFVAQAQFLF